MVVLVTCKKKIQSKIKVLEWSHYYSLIFRCSRVANSKVMESCGNSNLSKQLKALEWSHHFFHYKSMGIFPGAQGQLTPKSLVRSCPISSPSYILWLFSSFFFLFFLPFITFFSPSSDIQGVGEGHPSPCMPYKLQIWYSDGSLLTSFVHLSCIFKAITIQLYTTTQGQGQRSYIEFSCKCFSS